MEGEGEKKRRKFKVALFCGDDSASGKNNSHSGPFGTCVDGSGGDT